MARFCSDEFSSLPEEQVDNLAKLAYIRPLYPAVLRILPRRIAMRVRNFEGQIVTDLLLSTDHFRTSESITGPLVYRAFYDPYSTVCANRLATLDPPSSDRSTRM